ncbi:hypothetical protein [Microcoleus sp.]
MLAFREIAGVRSKSSPWPIAPETPPPDLLRGKDAFSSTKTEGLCFAW